MTKSIRTALISVYHKEGLDEIASLLLANNIIVYSTGGTQSYLESKGLEIQRVEDLTSYPSILDGRVKTLHPKVFGGILARREDSHLAQLESFEIPELDLVVVDLYPFEQTVASTEDDNEIIEKIDIGGISLIRAAAKNYKDVVVIPSVKFYPVLEKILSDQGGKTSLEDRKTLAYESFQISSHYDTAISDYFNKDMQKTDYLKVSVQESHGLRYGENPHQSATYYGDLSQDFDKLGGKALSYNNLVDIDAAIELMREFEDCPTTFAILKHTNSCGVATRGSCYEVYLAALAGDPVSAFGGILICNSPIDLKTAEEINKQFYEVLIAPVFNQDAVDLLMKKKNRVLLKQKHQPSQKRRLKSLLSGVLVQDADLKIENKEDLSSVTKRQPSEAEIDQLLFASKVVKHLKSNTIVLVKDNQLIGMGCGQTSRVDACIQAIDKAKRMGFDPGGAVMASDAFFPFPDCVELAWEAGITAVIQPGGSKNDHMSVDFCDEKNMAMVCTGVRHFKH
jgi:phosphoribosylaminoimidazolecarboxamide formyltransferase/IMP cyclohydrolase